MGYKYISLNLTKLFAYYCVTFYKDCLLAGVDYYNSRRFHEQTIQ